MALFLKQKPDLCGVWVDERNTETITPSIVRGVRHKLDIVILDSLGRNTIDLSQYDKFLFRIGNDYDLTTPIYLGVEPESIFVKDYTHNVYQNTCASMLSIRINPFSDELVKALGTKEKIKVILEITGFTKDDLEYPSFVAQGQLIIRNRVSLDVPPEDDKTITAILMNGILNKAILGKE